MVYNSKFVRGSGEDTKIRHVEKLKRSRAISPLANTKNSYGELFLFSLVNIENDEGWPRRACQVFEEKVRKWVGACK